MFTNCSKNAQIAIINTVSELLEDKKRVKAQLLSHKTSLTEFAHLVSVYQTLDKTLNNQT